MFGLTHRLDYGSMLLVGFFALFVDSLFPPSLGLSSVLRRVFGTRALIFGDVNIY